MKTFKSRISEVVAKLATKDRGQFNEDRCWMLLKEMYVGLADEQYQWLADRVEAEMMAAA